MKRTIMRIISCVLTVMMLVGSAQITLMVIAADINKHTSEGLIESEVSSSGDESNDSEEVTSIEEIPYIIGEDNDLREECEKHFLLSDGSYIAAVYNEPVHYMDDDEWVDGLYSVSATGYLRGRQTTPVLAAGTYTYQPT